MTVSEKVSDSSFKGMSSQDGLVPTLQIGANVEGLHSGVEGSSLVQ